MSQNHPGSLIGPIHIDSSIAININLGAKMSRERALMACADVWHKIRIIRGSYYAKEVVLKAILKSVEPNDLVPVNYHISGEDSFFIVRNCGPALDKLCKKSLIIKNTEGDALILMIILGFASIENLKIHIQPVLLTALTKKYDSQKKMLNLENFHADPDLGKIVYCPLFQQRTSNHVLKLAGTAIATIEHLNLQHNELYNISAIENANLKDLKYLDLRNNNLINMNALIPVKYINIIKLWLDGNPLCENYSSEKRYIESAKRYCPNLQQLDGVSIIPNIPLLCRDYFPDNKMQQFAHKFAVHFFTLYDQADRTILRGLYHKNAFYSMSFAVPNIQAAKTNLAQYTAHNRNLLKKSPIKKLAFLYHGQDDILIAFGKLPKSYHDRSSFKYDIMYDNGKCLVICVSGYFKKLSTGTKILWFTRTFILQALVDKEYYILNDQCHIDSAPANMTSDKILVQESYDEIVPVCFSPQEKSVLIARLGQVTTLNDEWAENYLSEANWDMRQALTNFMKDYKNSSVLDHAFKKD